MGEIYDRQKMQDELQRSDEFIDIFSKIVSGKVGYKAVIETKPMVKKCTDCGITLDMNQKFCHECGAKNEVPVKKN